MEPTSKEVRAQLDRIRLSQEFVASERLADFLRFVVEETLAGRASQITQYTVGVKGLGYPPSFDPQTNPIVRVQAGRLRRALDLYYGTTGSDDPVRIEVPRGTYVPIFRPNVDTISPGEKAVGSGLEVQATGPTAGPAAQAGPIGAKAAGPAELPVDASVEPLTEASLAILPFVNLSLDEDDYCFADGMTEEVGIALTRFADLRVVGPLNRLRGQQVGPRQIGRDYGVRFLLQGTTRRRGQGIRISCTLSETHGGDYLWGETYEYDLDATSLFEIEDDVVGQVVGTIGDAFGVIFRRLHPETYHEHLKSSVVTDAVLKYNHARVTLNPQAVLQANEAIESALSIQPDNALLVAMLAGNYYGDYLLDMNLVADAKAQAEELIKRAVALDAKLQLANYTMASVSCLYGRREQCIEYAQKAVALNPNSASESSGAGFLLCMVGEWEDGLALLNRGMRLNPHHPSWFYFVTFLHRYRHEAYDEALVEANRFNIPPLFWDPLIRAAALGQLGRTAEARSALEELLRLKPGFASRGQDLMRRLVFSDEHVEMLLDGLVKAGLDTVV